MANVALLVCMPEIVYSEFVVETLLPLTVNPYVKAVLTRVGMRSEYARTNLLGEFMNSGIEYVFIVDADMQIPYDALERMLAWQKKMISVLYFSRGDKPFPVIFKPEPIDTWPKNKYFGYPRDSMIEIGACGHGGLLIHRSVLEAMEQPYSQLGPYKNQPFVGSDLRLCMKAREEAGVKIWCDTSIKAGHYKPLPITEKMYLDDEEEYIAFWENEARKQREHMSNRLMQKEKENV